MSARLWISAICLLAAVVRLGAFILFDRFRHPEVWESETIASNVLAGKGFVFETLGTPYHSYMEPLYPGLCVLVYRLTNHSFLALGLVQIALGSALAWLVFACARRVVPEGAALVSALLAALHPGLIVYTTKFHPFTLDVALWCAAFAALLAFSPNRPWRSACAAGFILGLCILTRPTILACVPMFGWWIWQRSSRQTVQAAARLMALLACAAVVVTPWVWRNYEVQQRFILTRSGTSFVFWLGNNPYIFTGSAMTADGGEVVAWVPGPVQDRLHQLDELGQQDYFRQEAFRFVASHPAEFLKRSALKFAYFWWFSPQAGLLYPAGWRHGYEGFYVIIVALAAAGVWTRWRARLTRPTTWTATLMLLGCCLSIGLLQSVYYVEGRHRLAIEPLLLIFAGAGVHRLTRRQVA